MHLQIKLKQKFQVFFLFLKISIFVYFNFVKKCFRLYRVLVFRVEYDENFFVGRAKVSWTEWCGRGVLWADQRVVCSVAAGRHRAHLFALVASVGVCQWLCRQSECLLLCNRFRRAHHCFVALVCVADWCAGQSQRKQTRVCSVARDLFNIVWHYFQKELWSE